MVELVLQKFIRHRELRELLLATGKASLLEGNWWHDNFWGDCFCEACSQPGENRLGSALMAVRSVVK